MTFTRNGQPIDWPATVALPGSLSHGTLRTHDLIASFSPVVRDIDPERWAKIYNQSDDLSDEDVLMDFTDALEELAPDGYYFGAIEGDGSDFGFWEDPDSEEE